MTPSIARKVLLAFQTIGQGQVPVADLSTREREVRQALTRGAAYKQIAEEIGVSVHTIRTHVNHIYRKLQARSRREAVRKAGLFRKMTWLRRPADKK
jgi:DNA-binding NarL/FixJ family response regulator